MATGLLLGRKPPPRPHFPPPTSFGINRVPEKKPLDPEKLLNLGLDLTNTAKDKITEACELFGRIGSLARLNRENLEDKDVVKALTDLREDAEVLLERGLYSLDVAQEVRTRLAKGNIELGETVTRESSRRWTQCFYALAGVWARAYIKIYGMVLGLQTYGNLSHVPPKLQFEPPSWEARKRYDRRLAVAAAANFPLVVEYWRRRLIRGIEAGDLPGRVVLRDDARKARKVERYDEDGYSAAVGDNTYVRDGLAALAGGPDCTSFVDITKGMTSSEPNLLNSPGRENSPGSIPDAASARNPRGGPDSPDATTRVDDITEDSIDDIVGTPIGASTPKNNRGQTKAGGDSLQGPIAKSAQGDSVRVSRRLQAKREAKEAAPQELEPPSPPRAHAKRKRNTKSQAPSKEPAKKRRGTKSQAPAGEPAENRDKASSKRKRDTEAQNQGAPAVKKARVSPSPTKLRLREVEGQCVRDLTDNEIARLPWNKDKPAEANVDPRKLPRADDDFDGSEDEVTADETGAAEPEEDDHMEVGGGEPAVAALHDSRHTVGNPPSQGDRNQDSRVGGMLQTPSRHYPGPGSGDCVGIATPRQFEDPIPTETSIHSVPTATPELKNYAPQPPLPPHLRTWTPGIYKHFPPKDGLYSPNLGSSTFFRSSPFTHKGPTPKGPRMSASTPRRFTIEEISYAEEQAAEVGITTTEFLQGWVEHEEGPTSQAEGTTPRPVGGSPCSSRKRQTDCSGKATTTPAAETPRGRSSSPELPTPGRKHDTPAITKTPRRTSGLWGSTFLEEHGLPKGPTDDVSEVQNLPSSGPTAGAPKSPRTPPNWNRPSSEPTTGASQTPVGDGSTYIDPASRLHFPQPEPPKTPPRTPAPGGQGDTRDPPSGGSAKSGASMSSADRRVIHNALQEDIARYEAEDRAAASTAADRAATDRAILDAADIPHQGLSPRSAWNLVRGLTASIRDEEARLSSASAGDVDTETTDEPKKDGQGKESQKEEEQKDDAGKEAEEDDATWRARSDAQPEEIDCNDAFNRRVWDI